MSIKKNISYSREVTHENSRSVPPRLSESQRFPGPSSLAIPKQKFIAWAKKMPLESRFQVLLTSAPTLADDFRTAREDPVDRQISESGKARKYLQKRVKFEESIQQQFLDAILFYSNKDYLDSISLDFPFVDAPAKLYNLLLSLKAQSNPKKPLQLLDQKSLNSFYPFPQPNSEKKQFLKEVLKSIDTGKQIKNNKKSVDASSNETNQTQLVQLDIEDIARLKLEQQFIGLTDQISEQANQLFENRVLAYERLKYILQILSITVKVYGSCACGIATKNSDVDVAIDQSILNWYCYLYDPQSQIRAALDYLEAYFSQFSWIGEIKTIASASIPIIKLKINNSIPFHVGSISQDTFDYLNRNPQQSKTIQIDLTIETKITGVQHLGAISTQQTKKWMNSYPALRPILIFLKEKLSQKELNQTYYGGINTYTLLIMLVAVIQKQKLQTETKATIILEKFASFYGWEFPEKNQVVDLDSQEIFTYKINTNAISKDQADLEVRDPLNGGKVMTNKCYKFNQIRNIFRQIHQSWEQMLKLKLSDASRDPESEIQVQEFHSQKPI